MLIAIRFFKYPNIGGAEPVSIICDKFCCVVFNAPGFEHIIGREFFFQRFTHLRNNKSSRLADQVSEKLNALRNAAEGSANTMPYIIEAVRAYATLGEITDVFRLVFGTYVEPNWI